MSDTREEMRRIGERIRTTRKKQGMSMKTLGQKVGLSESMIWRYEKGDLKSIDVNMIKKIAVALNTESEILLGWDSENSSQVDPQWGDDEANIEYLKDNPRLLDQYIELTRKNDTIGLLFDKVKDLSPKDVEKVLKIVELIDQENE